MKIGVRSACGAAVLFAAMASSAAPPLKIAVQPLACVSRDRNARITARIEGPLKSARVYFRVVDPNCRDEYSVDMRQSSSDPILYWAVLPLVGIGTRSLSYRVRVSQGSGADIESALWNVAVSEHCIAEVLTPAEQRSAENIVLGLTTPTPQGIPCGFRCNGVRSILTTANELKPNEPCLFALASARPWYETRAGKGVFIGAAVIGGAFIWNQRREDDQPPSPARP